MRETAALISTQQVRGDGDLKRYVPILQYPTVTDAFELYMTSS
jgi:hypothetical protein